jgi:hypothetical protein
MLIERCMDNVLDLIFRLDLDNSALTDVCVPHRGWTLDVEPEV